MSIVEIGASALTPEKIYELLHSKGIAILDSSVSARFTTKTSIEYIVSDCKTERDSNLLAFILQLLNTDNSVPIEQLQQLIAGFHDNKSLISTPIHYTNFSASSVSYLVSISTSVLTFAYSVFSELVCIKSGAFMQEKAFTVRNFNQVAKNLSEEVRIYANGSKKHDLKKGDQNNQFLNIVKLKENDIILRQKAREELKCGVYQDGMENQIQYQFFESLYSSLLNAYQDSVYREFNLKQFSHIDGNWKPTQLMTPVQTSPLLEDLPTLLYSQLQSELQTSIHLLLSAQSALKKGKLQIGEGVMLFLNQLSTSSPTNNFPRLSVISLILKNTILPSNQSHRVPIPPPGTRDLLPNQMHSRKLALNLITEIFEKHGALQIETPTFETRAVLMGKYGEDQKLIFNLENFGEEICALRYDLTVPFSRFCATNGISQIKRYQIGRVFRRDKPVMEKGRFREFYQCDFDIAGNYASNVPDAEILCVISEILSGLKLGDFTVIVSDRRILDAVMGLCGVQNDKLRAVCGCVDQLDKISQEEVIEKIVGKGVDREIGVNVMKMLGFKSSGQEFQDKVKELEQNQELFTVIKPYLEDLAEVLNYLKLFNAQALKSIVIDFSLARGLDYYTGMIFEAKMTKTNSSIAGGGRYDKLLQNNIPAVGGSVGIERIFALLEQKSSQKQLLHVFIAAAPGSSLKERVRLAGMLQQNNVKCGLCLKDAGSLKQMKKDIDEAVEAGCKFCIFQGGEEMEREVLQVKDLETEEQVEIKADEMLQYILQRLGAKYIEFRDQWMKWIVQRVQEGEITVDDMMKMIQELNTKE
ncbi:Histidyl-tRNA synthetase [Spironucleus salmonicida]|uniref:histidine--tRNA ligase n=1 Tax=Spironucleus salmonicida TaxID=348837 RepID=V6LQI7_9EUKA|nr:Histidyl-tRNA synthetase [Spironucleus salmonicida]|eukprot:EST46937.1 Histidyl-tRNA synthetase [Spironucleus salmonicida]